MKKYSVGLQLKSSYPEEQMTIVAKNSDTAIVIAEQIYKRMGYTKKDLISLVLWYAD